MLADRFWSKVDQSGGPDACWPWLAKRAGAGYGQIRLDAADGSRYEYAHRVAFYLTRGYWPKVGRHSCDNPSCVNPAHVLDGTHSDNNRDSVRRGRWGYRGMPGNRNAAKKPGEGTRPYRRKGHSDRILD